VIILLMDGIYEIHRCESLDIQLGDIRHTKDPVAVPVLGATGGCPSDVKRFRNCTSNIS
jgi:hypothetical protein